ncbi:tetratricopeptide repeat protein [Marinilabiliaceae bacterium ANBcel2]|nr:tetratricopeptide repeat protein [Marinilabiliaceae bacterium ANBcel2]
MSKKENTTVENNIENVESALGRTEKFIEENQKLLTIGVLALILLVGGYWAYKQLYMEPREQEAQVQIFHAQHHFGNENFEAALEGDGINSGFLEIIDDFSRTAAGNLAKYYAGISYLHIGEFELSINYLEDFSTRNSELRAISTGAIGDAYLELGNEAQALSYYQRASRIDNDITAPFYLLKSGLVYESIGESSNALEIYTKIKKEYQNSAEAREIDKYISRVSALN